MLVYQRDSKWRGFFFCLLNFNERGAFVFSIDLLCQGVLRWLALSCIYRESALQQSWKALGFAEVAVLWHLPESIIITSTVWGKWEINNHQGEPAGFLMDWGNKEKFFPRSSTLLACLWPWSHSAVGTSWSLCFISFSASKVPFSWGQMPSSPNNDNNNNNHQTKKQKIKSSFHLGCLC